jgi:hypothetical protein
LDASFVEGLELEAVLRVIAIEEDKSTKLGLRELREVHAQLSSAGGRAAFVRAEDSLHEVVGVARSALAIEVAKAFAMLDATGARGDRNLLVAQLYNTYGLYSAEQDDVMVVRCGKEEWVGNVGRHFSLEGFVNLLVDQGRIEGVLGF